MIDEIVKINILYDFYGELLTSRQKEILRLYYEENLSLGEISQEYELTRQGIHKTIKRASKNLYNFEKKLKLWEKHREGKELLNSFREKIDKVKNKEKSTNDLLNLLDTFLEEVEGFI